MCSQTCVVFLPLQNSDDTHTPLRVMSPAKVLKATFVVLTLQFMSPGAHDVMKTERKTGTLWRLKSLLVMQLVNKNYTSSEEAPFLFAHLSLNM